MVQIGSALTGNARKVGEVRMGLTERQYITYENKKAYDNGYVKGFHDAKTLEENLVEFGVKIGFLTPEKAEQLLKEQPQIVRCKDCKECYFASNRVPTEQSYVCGKHGIGVSLEWFCADGVAKDINVLGNEGR